jgi:hypothetical protein
MEKVVALLYSADEGTKSFETSDITRQTTLGHIKDDLYFSYTAERTSNNAITRYVRSLNEIRRTISPTTLGSLQ